MFRRMKEDVQSIFTRDPAARSWLDVLTHYPGVHALVLHRVASYLWRRGCQWLARTIAALGRWLTGIEIHPGAKIGRRLFIDHGMGVVIGETAEVGDDVTLYQGVTLGGTSWKPGKRHPTLGNGVVVGAGAKILGPIVVGGGAKIGSNAVVTKTVPANMTVVGVPGRCVHEKSAMGSMQAADDDQQSDVSKANASFNAYGVTPDKPDPIAQSLGSLLMHLQTLERKVSILSKALDQLHHDRTIVSQHVIQNTDHDVSKKQTGQEKNSS